MDIGAAHISLVGIQVFPRALQADIVYPAVCHGTGVLICLHGCAGRLSLSVEPEVSPCPFRALRINRRALCAVINVMRAAIQGGYSPEEAVAVVLEGIIFLCLLRSIQVALFIVGIA